MLELRVKCFKNPEESGYVAPELEELRREAVSLSSAEGRGFQEEESLHLEAQVWECAHLKEKINAARTQRLWGEWAPTRYKEIEIHKVLATKPKIFACVFTNILWPNSSELLWGFFSGLASNSGL